MKVKELTLKSAVFKYAIIGGKKKHVLFFKFEEAGHVCEYIHTLGRIQGIVAYINRELTTTMLELKHPLKLIALWEDREQTIRGINLKAEVVILGTTRYNGTIVRVNRVYNASNR